MTKAEPRKPAPGAHSLAIDEYIAAWPNAIQDKMQTVRQLIHDTVPEVTEKMGYGIPTFQLDGKNLCHFSGNKLHLGFYPGPPAIAAHAGELAAYKTSKGAIQIPYTMELPLALLTRIILYARANLEELAEARRKK